MQRSRGPTLRVRAPAEEWPVTFEHIIYIPGVLLVGVTLGYILGARAVRAELKAAKKRARH